MSICAARWAIWLGMLAGLCGLGAAQAQVGDPVSSNELDVLEQRALQEGEAGKSDAAIVDYKRVLEARPQWKEGWWNLGTLEYGSGRFDEAEGVFRRVTGFAPDLGMAWGLLGLSEYEIKQYDEALPDLEKARTVGIKDDAEVERVSNYHLALLLIRAGEFERASELLMAGFGAGTASNQVQMALGMAVLRVPLLPEQVDPSQEALVLAAGSAVLGGADAPTAFQRLIEANPEVPYLHLACGIAFVQSGRLADAKKMFARETVVSPMSAAPWVELSKIAAQERNAVEASKASEKAVALGGQERGANQSLAAPRSPEARLPEARIVSIYAKNTNKSGAADPQLWARAMREYSGGEYAKAVDDLKVWLAGSPESGTGWAVLGLSEFALKEDDNALIHLERGARIGLSGSPESVGTAKVTYGLLLVRAGRFDQGAEVLASAHAAGDLAGRAEAGAGLALLRRAELAGSSTEPVPLVAGAGKIEFLLQQSKYDEAFPLFKQLLAQYPAVPFLHYAYGTALLAMSEFDGAAAEMQAEVKLSPKSELPCVRLASIALRQHQAAEAISWAKRAIALDSQSAEGHYLLGRASLEAGDAATALAELETASRLSPESPEVHFNLAKAYARADLAEKAERERAVFSQLNALAESQKSHGGTQIYTGPHEADDLSGAAGSTKAVNRP